MRRTSARRGTKAAVATILVAGLPVVAVVISAPPAAAAAPPAPGRLAYVGEHHDELAYAVDGEQTPLFPNEAGPSTVDYDATADQNGGLAWISTRVDRKGDLYYLAPGDEAPTRLAANAATERQPRFSPDGTQIAFVSDRGGATQIWAVNTDGTNLRQITSVPVATPRPADTWPTWSPDSSRIAFTSTRNNPNGDLYTTTVTPAPVTPVRITTSSATGGAIQPAWDPIVDHNRIAFTRTSTTTPGRSSVLSIAPNGTGTATNLVPNWDAGQASWNADGTTIAFVSRRQNADGGVFVKTVDDIGGGAPDPELVRDDARNPEQRPAWYYLPEQPPLVIYTHHAVDEIGEIRDLQATDGTGDRDLSFRPGKFESAPAYSPDGRKVAYSRRNGTVTDIVTINADATTVNPTVLTRPRTPEKDTDPVFSPDGTKLAFVRNNRIVVINSTTGAELLRVPPPPPTSPNNGFLDGEPSWTADGQRLVFARYIIPPTVPPIGVQKRALAQPHALDGLDTDIWSVRASDGGDQIALTAADDTPAETQFDRTPRVAPNGLTLLFNRNGRLRLWDLAANVPTGAQRDLPIPAAANDPISGVQYPAWAPDAKSVAFSAVRGPSGGRDIGVVTVPVTGDPTLRWLTSFVGNENQPAWQPAADLEVTLSPSDPEILAGETTTLTATATNLGQAGARKVRVAVTLPAGLTFAGISSPTTGAVCSAVSVACEINGPVAAEATLVVNVVALGQVAGTYTPTAAVTGSILDLNLANNQASTQVVVTSLPDVDFRDIGVTMTVPQAGFAGGDPLVTTYTVRNGGEVPATAVTLDTVLPANLRRGVVTGCQLQGTKCALGPMAPGDIRTVSVALSPDAKIDAPIAGTVTATFPRGGDDNVDNDRADATLKVLQPTLTISPAVGPPGTVARVTGKDFPPGVTLNLAWETGINPPGKPVVIAPDGTFLARAFVFRRDQLGQRQIAVSGLRFGAVRDDFLVVRRTQSPPDLAYQG